MVNEYYKKSKEMLEKETRERYQNISEEKKEKRPKKRLKIHRKFFLKTKREENVSVIVIAVRIF